MPATSIPDSFLREGRDMTLANAAERWGTTRRTIQNWRRRAGFAKVQHHAFRPMPDDFMDRAHRLTLGEARKVWEASYYTVRGWYDAARIQPARFDYSTCARNFQASPKGRNVMPGGFNLLPQADSSLEGRAASWLKSKGYTPVHRCADDRGGFDLDGKLWRCGMVVETAEQMMARARRLGWDADEWKRAA